MSRRHKKHTNLTSVSISIRRNILLILWRILDSSMIFLEDSLKGAGLGLQMKVLRRSHMDSRSQGKERTQSWITSSPYNTTGKRARTALICCSWGDACWWRVSSNRLGLLFDPLWSSLNYINRACLRWGRTAVQCSFRTSLLLECWQLSKGREKGN